MFSTCSKARVDHIFDVSDLIELMAAFGGFELAMMDGLMLAGSVRRWVIVVDGLPACAALRWRGAIAPAVDDCVHARSHRSSGLDHALALIGAPPLVHGDIDAIDGAGATLAWPLLRSAAASCLEARDTTLDRAGVKVHCMETGMEQDESAFERTLAQLRESPRRWLVTGAAGFIGSHLLETLLRHGQAVVGLDNFATGHQRNLDEVRTLVTPVQWARLKFLEGDIRNVGMCRDACGGIDFVLHQAALGSVPRSIADPLIAHAVNVDGFVNMLVAARDAGVSRFVYAASSSTYGDHPDLPKVEGKIGRPLSPYAVTKLVNELYADVFARCYGIDAIGLRYFNVFGPRQDPLGAYAAVIPKWTAAMLDGAPVEIHGDGQTSRDFCFVANAVQANVMAASLAPRGARSEVYNIAVGERTSLVRLHELLALNVARVRPEVGSMPPRFGPFRAGDVQHSQAAIDKARRDLGYAPGYRVEDGLAITVDWHHGQRPLGVAAQA